MQFRVATLVGAVNSKGVTEASVSVVANGAFGMTLINFIGMSIHFAVIHRSISRRHLLPTHRWLAVAIIAQRTPMYCRSRTMHTSTILRPHNPTFVSQLTTAQSVRNVAS